MLKNNGYVYIRTHYSYDNDNVCKLGETINIPNRDSQYATGELKRGCFKIVIEILPEQIYTSLSVEKILQKYFIKYHAKYNAENEYNL